MKRINTKHQRHRRNGPFSRLLPPLPSSLVMLLNQPAARRSIIIHEMKSSTLTFYKDILKQHYSSHSSLERKNARQQKRILALLRAIVVVQALKLSATIIQRNVRRYIAGVKQIEAQRIQCWWYTVEAIRTFQLTKALRFFNRLLFQKLLRFFTIWRNEIKLWLYQKNMIGEKGLVFDKWCAYTKKIVTFKIKMKAALTLRHCPPVVKAWEVYTKKCIAVRTFVLKLIMGAKRRNFDRMVLLVVATRTSTRLQNFIRCVNAQYVLHRLKVKALATQLSGSFIRMGGRQATTEIRRRGAVALQKVMRGRMGRLWSKTYRTELTKTFQDIQNNWKRTTRLAGKLAIRNALVKLNTHIFEEEPKSDTSKTTSSNNVKESAFGIMGCLKRSPRRLASMATPTSDATHAHVDDFSDRKVYDYSGGSIASAAFCEVDVHCVGRVPLSAAETLFKRANLHMNKSEAILNGSLLVQNGQIHRHTFEAFLKDGVVYEASTTPTELHVSTMTKIIRGRQLKAIRLLRLVNGERAKKRQERKAIRSAQLEGQLIAWKKHDDLNKIHCLQCRQHFMTSSELLLDHLQIKPKELLKEFRPRQIMQQHKFSCPLFPGINPKSKKNYLQDVYANDLIFEELELLGERAPHALNRLNTGGLLS